MASKVEKYIEMQREKNTKFCIRSSFNRYFKELKTTEEEYFKKERDYSIDIWNFYQSLHDNAPLTQRQYINVILNFFEWNDIEIDKKILRKIKLGLKSARPITIDDAPTKEELKEILSYANLKGRAFVLLATSSGMRVGEILHLLPEDIDLNHTPAKIMIKSTYTKSRRPRIAFMSNEAKEALKQWLTKQHFTDEDGVTYYESERERYLRYTCAKLKEIKHVQKDRNDPRIFPLTNSSIRKSWVGMLKKSGHAQISSESGRLVFHIHTLRKFFLSQMKTKIPHVIVEALAGHDRYLDDAYRRYTHKQLGEYYLQGVSSVKIYDISPQTKELENRVNQLQKENKLLNKKIDDRRNAEINLFKDLYIHLLKSEATKDDLEQKRKEIEKKHSKKIPSINTSNKEMIKALEDFISNTTK